MRWESDLIFPQIEPSCHKTIYLFFFFLRFYVFIWQQEREHTFKQGKRQAEGEAGSLLCSTWGSIPGPWDHDPSRRQMFNRLSHPSAPKPFIFLKEMPPSPYTRFLDLFVFVCILYSLLLISLFTHQYQNLKITTVLQYDLKWYWAVITH